MPSKGHFERSLVADVEEQGTVVVVGVVSLNKRSIHYLTSNAAFVKLVTLNRRIEWAIIYSEVPSREALPSIGYSDFPIL